LWTRASCTNAWVWRSGSMSSSSCDMVW
jgi:hypothetical protein